MKKVVHEWFNRPASADCHIPACQQRPLLRRVGQCGHRCEWKMRTMMYLLLRYRAFDMRDVIILIIGLIVILRAIILLIDHCCRFTVAERVLYSPSMGFVILMGLFLSSLSLCAQGTFRFEYWRFFSFWHYVSLMQILINAIETSIVRRMSYFGTTIAVLLISLYSIKTIVWTYFTLELNFARFWAYR